MPRPFIRQWLTYGSAPGNTQREICGLVCCTVSSPLCTQLKQAPVALDEVMTKYEVLNR